MDHSQNKPKSHILHTLEPGKDTWSKTRSFFITVLHHKIVGNAFFGIRGAWGQSPALLRMVCRLEQGT